MTDTNDTLSQLTVLAEDLVMEREYKAEYEEILKRANGRIEKIELKMIGIMQENDLPKFGHDNRLFYTMVSSFPKVVDEDKFYPWLEEHGEDGIIKRTIHAQTLRAWYKDAEKYYEELADGQMLFVFEKVRIGMRKT